MIGLALVAFVTVFAAGLKSSVAQVVDENFAGGLVIQNTDGFSPIPNGAARGGAQGARGRSWSRRSAAPRRRCSERRRASRPGHGADPRHRRGGERSNGRRAGRRRCATSSDREAILSDDFASAHGLEVGRQLPAADPDRAQRPRFRVVGEFDSKLGVFGSVARHPAR